MGYTIKFKRKTAARWLELNPVLEEGEPGYEKDTGAFKIGDGVTAWDELPYSTSGGGSGVTTTVNGESGAVTIEAGSNVTVSKSGKTITIGASLGESFDYIVTTLTSAAIQSALDSAAADGGGVVLLSPGTYVVTGTIEIPSNTALIGKGNVILQRSAAINAIVINKADGTTGGYLAAKNMQVENIKFDANNANYPTDSTSIAFGHAKNIKAKNCEFYGVNTTWHDFEVNAASNVLFERCYFHGYAGSTESVQIDLANSSSCFPWFGPYDNTPCRNITFRECIFEGSNVTDAKAIGNHTFVSGYYPEYVTIENCAFTNFLDTVNLQDVSHFRIEGNDFVGCRKAVSFNYQSNNVVDWKLLNNTHVQTYSGDNVDDRFFYTPGTIASALRMVGLDLIGNRISGCHTHGIGLTATDVVIHGNIITGCGKNAIYVYGGSNVTISGNICKDNNLMVESGRGDIVFGNNSSVASSKVAVVSNVVDSVVIGTNIDDGIVTGNVISTAITNNSGGTECTSANNLINGTWVGSGTTYTDENAQDAVGGILADSTEIDFTYDDATPSITAILKATGIEAGSYTNVNITVDSKGRITAIEDGSASGVTVDTAMSDTSTNPVQNKVIKAYVDSAGGATASESIWGGM